MRIIPAIDILGGKCVRLTQGDYSTKKIYNVSPLDAAKAIEDCGLKYIHIVDLDGAREKKVKNFKALEMIASGTSLLIDFGGGIRSEQDMNTSFNSGANQVTAGSIAVTSRDIFLEWIMKFGNEKIILGADCRAGKIVTEGWTHTSDNDIITFISDYVSMGIKYTICTDMEKDGMLTGPATELYNDILKSIKVNLVASGGISTIDDIERIRETGCEGVIIGKAIYEGKIKLKELGALC
jgi:phosphoribosylformimino-5-aminoimidazole carboxamide ribotide isomerase